MTIASEEIFDVVDALDRVIGQATRETVHRDGLFHRAVHVFAFNSTGEIFLQRRAFTKDSAPGLWSSSCSGHVDAGESYEQATLRELVEEIGLTLDPEALLLRLAVSPCPATENEFARVYRCFADPPLTLDPDEVMDGLWLAEVKLNSWILREPEAFAPSFLHLYALNRMAERRE